MSYVFTRESLNPVSSWIQGLPFVQTEIDVHIMLEDIEDLSHKTFQSVQAAHETLGVVTSIWEYYIHVVSPQDTTITRKINQLAGFISPQLDSCACSAQSSPDMTTLLENLSPMSSQESPSCSFQQPVRTMEVNKPCTSKGTQEAPSCSSHPQKTGLVCSKSCAPMVPQEPPVCSAVRTFSFRTEPITKLLNWIDSLEKTHVGVDGNRMRKGVQTLSLQRFPNLDAAEEHLSQLFEAWIRQLHSIGVDPSSVTRIIPLYIEFLVVPTSELERDRLSIDHPTNTLAKMSTWEIYRLNEKALELSRSLAEIQRSTDSDALKREKSLPIQNRLAEITELLRFSTLELQARGPARWVYPEPKGWASGTMH